MLAVTEADLAWRCLQQDSPTMSEQAAGGDESEAIRFELEAGSPDSFVGGKTPSKFGYGLPRLLEASGPHLHTIVHERGSRPFLSIVILYLNRLRHIL